MINKRLVWYLEKEKKIDDRQFSFRKQKITLNGISKIPWIQEKKENRSNLL